MVFDAFARTGIVRCPPLDDLIDTLAFAAGHTRGQAHRLAGLRRRKVVPGLRDRDWMSRPTPRRRGNSATYRCRSCAENPLDTGAGLASQQEIQRHLPHRRRRSQHWI
jgi:hypothetical protein